MTPTLSVILFAFNEADNVQPIVEELRRWLADHRPDAEIIFVDDGSSDATFQAAEHALHGAAARIVRHETNLGIGAAIKTGVRAASAPWITFMPADGQIPPTAIGQLTDAAALHGADLVLSVYAQRDDGLDRKLLSWGVRTLIRWVHGVRLHSDGPYLFRRELFDVAQLRPNSFFLNFEFPIRMLRRGVRWTTVTIPCRSRHAGRSKSAKLATVLIIARDVVAMRSR